MNIPTIPGELHHAWLVATLALSDAELDMARAKNKVADLTAQRIALLQNAWGIKVGDRVRIKSGKIVFVHAIAVAPDNLGIQSRPVLGIRHYRRDGTLSDVVQEYYDTWEKVDDAT